MGVSIWEGDKAERVASALEAIAQGGGGTDDYEELDNKPSINNVTLVGNKTLSDLGAASASDLSAKYTKPQDGIPASDLASGVIPTVHNVPAGGSAGQVLTKTSGTDYEAEWATPQVATDAQVAEAVDDWLGDNVAQETGYVLDRTLLLSNAAAPADLVGDLKNEIPPIKDSEETGVDLDVSDPQGYVILRLADGHIQTKEFDSSEVVADLEEVKDDLETLSGTVEEKITEPETAGTSGQVLGLDSELNPVWVNQTGGNSDIAVKDSTKTGVDLDISDSQGNVVLRVKDGNVFSKWFSSDNVDGSADYNLDIVYTNASGVATINKAFHEGDKIILHFVDADDRKTDGIATYTVTYSYTDTSNTDHTIAAVYGYDYCPFVFPEDAVSVKVSYGTGLLWGENGKLRFSIYKKGIAERKPHIIKVASDGSGDFTTLREAVDSIADNNAYNRYRIEVYPGTYDVLDDYSSDEIEASGFEGLFIGDGVSLVGIGQKDDVILAGTLDTSSYDASIRRIISTINLAGNSNLENLTINAENLRYCVHDDTGTMPHQEAIKEIKNCVFNAKTMETRDIAYGCGISNKRKLHFKNCVFNQELHIHTHNNGTYSPEVIIEDCEGVIFSFADYNSIVDIVYSLNNCKFAVIIAETSYGPHDQFLFVNQIGGTEPIIECESGQVYNLANCVAIRGQVSAGQLVKTNIGNGVTSLTSVTSKESATGVSIGNVDNNTIVASGGYINSNQVGLSGLTVGEYITVDSNGKLSGGGTSANAVGIVIGISPRQTGGAYIKLFV